MKTKFLASIVTVAALMGLGGCATMDRQTVGTVGGAVVGGVIGNAVGGTAATIGGAAIGGVLGNEAAKR